MCNSMNTNKKYIAYYDCGNLQIGYVGSICTCDKCRKRGVAEVIINDLGGFYLGRIKANELKDVVYFGNSILNMMNEIKNILEQTNKEKIYLQS